MRPNRKRLIGWALTIFVVAVVSFHAGRLYQHHYTETHLWELIDQTDDRP